MKFPKRTKGAWFWFGIWTVMAIALGILAYRSPDWGATCFYRRLGYADWHSALAPGCAATFREVDAFF